MGPLLQVVKKKVFEVFVLANVYQTIRLHRMNGFGLNSDDTKRMQSKIGPRRQLKQQTVTQQSRVNVG